MGRRLVTKSPRVNEKGEMVVNFAADRIGGMQVSRDEVPDTLCLPFGSASPVLADRKHLVITFQTDRTVIDGSSPVDVHAGYLTQGAGRGPDGVSPPSTNLYSNRKQFLRGQYLHLSLLPSVEVCANSTNIEIVAGLEMS